MKKFLLIILLIIVIGGVFMFEYIPNKENKKKEVTLTDEFTPNLIKLTNRDYQDNYLISPYSIKVALNMLKEGANDNTLDEINKALGNTKVASINNDNIKIANGLFIRNSVKDIVESNFVKTISKKYNGEVLYDDFKTPDVINNWVNEQTDQMIPKILDSISSDFVLGLANALAIDVKWAHEFECETTTKETFTRKDSTTMNIQMMHHTYESSDVSYFDNDNVKGIILPYEEDTNLEFIALLPKQDINTYLSNLKEEDLLNIDKDKISASDKLHINLSLPRFKYDFDLSTFESILHELGINDVFDLDKANLYKIISKENIDKNNLVNIYVDTAIHKTAIDLNEVGTKAAAVTYFGMKAGSALLDDFETVDINLNKTFAYMIREKTTKEVLFFGVVNTPNRWSGSTCAND